MKNNTEADGKEELSLEIIARYTDDPNFSESECKSIKDEADVVNHTKADHDVTLDDNAELGSSRWTTTMVDGEDGLAPAYRELIRELEEHRQHFKVDQARF